MDTAVTENLPQAQEARSYLRETSQPIYSAALILPFLVVYELGLIFLKSDVINGGDAILLNLGGPLMRAIGMHASIVPLVVLGLYLVIAQIRKSNGWSLRASTMGVLFLESLLYAILLFVLLGLFLRHLPGMNATRPESQRPMAGLSVPQDNPHTMHAAKPAEALPHTPAAPPQRYQPGIQDFVLYCGAGVYEELVFRVLLLGLLMLVFTKLFHMEHAYAAVWSTMLGALIFSSFHHIGGEPFVAGVFSQRVFAGVYFSALYFTRSFGVAAASHALYDIVVGLNQYV
jgi:hypothetical protein